MDDSVAVGSEACGAGVAEDARERQPLRKHLDTAVTASYVRDRSVQAASPSFREESSRKKLEEGHDEQWVTALESPCSER